jgi:hypothetical protein
MITYVTFKLLKTNKPLLLRTHFAGGLPGNLPGAFRSITFTFHKPNWAIGMFMTGTISEFT